MKKAFVISFLSVLLIAINSCKKCYNCTTYIEPPDVIDTIYYYGQVKYDTLVGLAVPNAIFSSCGNNASYQYGNYAAPFHSLADTFTYCIEK